MAAKIMAMLADGMTASQVLAELPDLEAEDVVEALRLTADAVRE